MLLRSRIPARNGGRGGLYSEEGSELDEAGETLVLCARL